MLVYMTAKYIKREQELYYYNSTTTNSTSAGLDEFIALGYGLMILTMSLGFGVFLLIQRINSHCPIAIVD